MGVVGQQPDRAHSQGAQAGGRVAVLAHLGREAEVPVGLECVEAVVLQDVGAKLVEQADPTALVARRVEQQPATLRADRAQGRP